MPQRTTNPIATSLLLLPLITLLQPPPAASAATNPYYTNCSRPIRCGSSNVEVSYPFHLPNSPDYCGVPGYELSCSDVDSDLTIKLSGNDYAVKDIDYNNGFLTVVDAYFLENPCPHAFTNTSFNSALFDFMDVDFNVTVFVNCTFPQVSGLSEIPCLGDLFGTRSYYKVQEGPSSFLLGLTGLCDLAAAVPVYQTAANSLNSTSKKFSEALQQGFRLTWSAGKDWCKRCIDAGGVCGYNSTQASDHTCFCSNNTALGSCPYGSKHTGKHSISRKVIIGLTSGLMCFLLVCIVLMYHCVSKFNSLNNIFFRQKNKIALNIEAFLVTYESLGPKRYRYSDLKKITKKFSEKLGQGGYGAVFKGKFPDGRLVAVKVLSDAKGNGDEFVNEVASIGRTSHVNVVSLLGFSSEGSRRALIYEFMSNGSLEKYIYSENLKSTLGWEKLYQIAVGIAQGLEYLHRGCNARIVHFDIKPHNILLDHDFCPKISDFGLAKLHLRKDSILSAIDARGTIGYIAPEVLFRNFGVVSSKSDVYSYGMMVMEMVGGTNTSMHSGDSSSQLYFPHWIYEHFHQIGHMEGVNVTGETEEIAKKMILVGLWCIQAKPESRPSMSKVVDMLESSIDDLEMPPKPYSSSP